MIPRQLIISVAHCVLKISLYSLNASTNMSDFPPLHSHGFPQVEMSGSGRVTKPATTDGEDAIIQVTLTSSLQQYSSKLTNTS